jgi:hypothetical protein
MQVVTIPEPLSLIVWGEYNEWCNQCVGKYGTDWWVSYDNTMVVSHVCYVFNNPEDAVKFSLTWL